MTATRSTLHFSTPRPEHREPSPDDPAEFSLANPAHYELVSRLFHGRFIGRVRAAGLDPEDAFQGVLEGLLRKCASPRSRWDPTRGSVSTWAYVACSGLVSNMIQAARTRALSAPGASADVSAWESLVDDGPLPDDLAADREDEGPVSPWALALGRGIPFHEAALLLPFLGAEAPPTRRRPRRRTRRAPRPLPPRVAAVVSTLCLPRPVEAAVLAGRGSLFSRLVSSGWSFLDASTAAQVLDAAQRRPRR